ncbi:hypothetical protein JDV09_20000 [Mycobacterium sp. Y57]|uniref:hypothetical protein n=1 Tax=Mycolicibacterium xanthum TaxID=2796469 RepID=UPI001C862647|nr:hypothetical protein [Mycolicibacterium xanthum]MBX7434361.1 hypothetical protein [Mycolicibacterium xanthum]
MNRPYTAQSPYALTPTERIRSTRAGGRYSRDLDDDDRYGDLDTDEYPRYLDDDYDPYEPVDYDHAIDEARIDRRWMWIAGVCGAVLFVAVIATSMILSGGDSGSVSATVAAPVSSPSAAPAPSPTRSPAPAPSATATPSLPAETVTTITPSAQTPPPAPTSSLLPAPQAAPPPVSAAPGTITYRITGNRQLIDLVTVIYTDQQGALQTEVNAALPWSKTVVLDPGVTLSSVTATSVRGQLNCSITDANGNVIASQNNNSIITNCTR